MLVKETKLPEVKIIEPKVFGDDRGFFMETWNQRTFEQLVTNCSCEFVQDNHSKSSANILRGLHFQSENPQGKLVRVIAGEVFDVAVDVRKDSPTFGQWVGVYLSAENRKQLWIPPGFAHGFYVTSPSAEFVYKCTDYYNPAYEHTLAWDDESVGIRWPVGKDNSPILSKKDSQGLSLSQVLQVINA